MKGIELGTSKRMSEVIAEVAGVDPGRVVVVTGPNLAARDRRRAADRDRGRLRGRRTGRRGAARSPPPYFRPYTNDDVIGCELGGAVKNVIALAYGMATGMGLGDNTKATLITRGLAETARLGVRLGADPLTFAGLAGLGDLVATCMSPLSRNRTFGEHLGRGETWRRRRRPPGRPPRGCKSCLAIRDLARAHGVEMPITEQVEQVCHEGVDPRAAVTALMSRSTKPE